MVLRQFDTPEGTPGRTVSPFTDTDWMAVYDELSGRFFIGAQGKLWIEVYTALWLVEFVPADLNSHGWWCKDTMKTEFRCLMCKGGYLK